LIIAALGCIVAAGVATAAAPTATTQPATNVTATSATLNGTVAPNGEPTTYHFEYGTTTAYGSRTPEQTVTGNKSKKVSSTVFGLQPSTTYHFRVVATNASGTVNGADMTFRTAAAGPNTNLVSIIATPRTVTFGNATTISGRVTGPNAGGVRVTLESSPFPFAAPFRQEATTTTDASGNYVFAGLRPPVITRYHVVARTRPQSQSPDRNVNVRPRVTIRVNDRTPARGQRVRFSGHVTPAHDGAVVRIQRHTRAGWRTVARAALKPALPAGGVARSRYVKRIRVRRGGYYRTYFPKADGDHVRSKSRRVRLRVH
jgi:hypothetical protein